MTKWIINIIAFIIVAGILIASLASTDSDDDARALYMLPALIITTVYLGAMFIIYLLPAITDKATNAVLGSNEEVEPDPLRDARAAQARGDYDEAIAVYLSVTNEDPENSMPWIEIAKIQHDKLDDPDAAIFTLHNALNSQVWEMDDAAYFMQRLSEIYIEDKNDPESGVKILQQITETYPETSHSTTALQKLREMGVIEPI